MTHTDLLEYRLTRWARPRLPRVFADVLIFTFKQGWACLFGACLLLAIIVTRLVWQPDWPIARYDALVVIGVALQAAFLWFRLETWSEARVIALFHLTGTAMEVFKVHAGSWSYPEPGLLKFYDVPLFSGFMYAAVGSYMARVIRLFDMDFSPFPPMAAHFALGIAIYLNFFMHHFSVDLRLVLFAATLVLYARTRITFRVGRRCYWMPLPLAAFMSSFFLWLAENIGTMTGTWLYAGQNPFDTVSFAKMGSWYLLLYVAFATVTLVVPIGRRSVTRSRDLPRPKRPRQTRRSAPRKWMPERPAPGP